MTDSVLSDRELLELAAKAAEIEVSFGSEGCLWKPLGTKYLLGRWNTLVDDGDALRLAVKLFFTVKVAPHECEVFNEFGECLWSEEHAGGNNHKEITRRAIARAAASIGRSIGTNKPEV